MTQMPPPIEEFDDTCTCGHVRGEHFMPQGGPTQHCLMDGCDCTAFELDRPENNKAKTTGA
jgi:hypothetical protein